MGCLSGLAKAGGVHLTGANACCSGAGGRESGAFPKWLKVFPADEK